MADNAWISADTRGGGEGQGIDIGVTGQVTMRNGAQITADTLGSGSGGDLTVKADKMLLSGDFTSVDALDHVGGSRDLGDITVTAGSLEVRNGAGIHTAPFVQGEGGNVTVTADRVLLSDDGAHFGTGISSGGDIFNAIIIPGGGGAGNVTVNAGSLEVRNGAGISTVPLAAPGITGRSGNVTVTADRVFLSGDGTTSTGITTAGFEVVDTRFGTFRVDAGNVTIQAGSLEVHNGAVISSSFSGSVGSEGHGGDVTVTADRVLLSGDGANFGRLLPTGVFAEAFDGGVAGNVTVNAGSLEVRNGAGISTSFSGFPGSKGHGGDVKINATDITLQDGGIISTESTAAISSAGTPVDAGNITLEVGNLLHLGNGSSITTSAAGGEGSGGNIAIGSVLVVLDEGSRIIANATRGQGGNILIHILRGGALFRSPDSRIDASSEFGIDGSVVIDAPDKDIIAGFAGLPANFWDAATVLTQLCAERSGANVSSLVVRKYEVLPDSPYALRVQLPRTMPAPRTAKQSRTPRTYYAGGPLPPMISCLWNG